jgi:hypothetical protein
LRSAVAIEEDVSVDLGNDKPHGRAAAILCSLNRIRSKSGKVKHRVSIKAYSSRSL